MLRFMFPLCLRRLISTLFFERCLASVSFGSYDLDLGRGCWSGSCL